MGKEAHRYQLTNAIAGVVESFNNIDEAWENYQLRICDAFQFEEDLRKQGMDNTLSATECRALYALKDLVSGQLITQMNYETMKMQRVSEEQQKSFTISGEAPYFTGSNLQEAILSYERRMRIINNNYDRKN